MTHNSGKTNVCHIYFPVKSSGSRVHLPRLSNRNAHDCWQKILVHYFGMLSFIMLKPYRSVAWLTWTDIVLLSQDLLLSWNKKAHENTWTSLVPKATLVIWYTPLSLCLIHIWAKFYMHVCLYSDSFCHVSLRILPSITLSIEEKEIYSEIWSQQTTLTCVAPGDATHISHRLHFRKVSNTPGFKLKLFKIWSAALRVALGATAPIEKQWESTKQFDCSSCENTFRLSASSMYVR